MYKIYRGDDPSNNSFENDLDIKRMNFAPLNILFLDFRDVSWSSYRCNITEISAAAAQYA